MSLHYDLLTIHSYPVAIIVDFFLCYSWALTLIPPSAEQALNRSFFVYVHPFSMILEPIRRTIWSFFCVENEHLRNTMGFRTEQFIPLHYERGVGEPPEDNSDQGRRLKQQNKLMISFIIAVVVALSIVAIVVLEEDPKNH